MSGLGRTLVVLGLALVAAGLLVSVAGKLGLPKSGKLPGDIVYRGERFTLHFPLVTCLLASALLTLALLLFGRR